MADDGVVRILPVRKTLDFATIFGILTAFALVVAAVFLGGSPSSFFNVPAILIVLGGTFAVTTICFSFAEMRRTVKVIGKTLFHSTRDASEAAIQIMQIAQMARKHGVLSLQDITDQTRREPFLFKGISMIVDGLPGDQVERILRREMASTTERHQKSASILRRAAEFSPAMGLIGTLIGLVQMLGNLEDPTTIGPSMAVALLTTFYGAILANLVFIPLASKLERNSALEETVNGIYLLGASSVGRQENPRRLEMMLNSMMPPSARIQYFE
jgi:chemotaxis protein MotA